MKISLLWSLILISILYSLEITDRFDLPLFDESLYAQGRYNRLRDWGPAYQLAYFILNSITNSRIESFYIMTYLISFLFIPIIIYALSYRFTKSIETSSIIAIWSIVSSWNFPTDPKIQLFNFCLIGLAFLIRNPSSKYHDIRNYLSYIILTFSLFCRTDNMIILAVIFIYDSYQNFKLKSYKSIIPAICLPSITYMTCLFQFGSPFKSTRTWFAFADHFFWKNGEYFKEQIENNIAVHTAINHFFNGAQTIGGAVIAQPLKVTKHFFLNLMTLPESILKNFGILYFGWLSVPLFLIFIFILLSREQEEVLIQDNKQKSEFKLLAIALTLKCLATGLLLQALPKYIFEINILIILIFVCYIPKLKFIPKRIVNVSIIVFITILMVSPFINKQKAFKHKFQMNDALRIIENIKQKRPIRMSLCSDAFITWSSIQTPMINLWPDRSYDARIKENLKQLLKQEKVDLIIMEGSHRYLMRIQGYGAQWADFETNWNNYGYDLVYRENPNTLSIYTRQESDTTQL